MSDESGDMPPPPPTPLPPAREGPPHAAPAELFVVPPAPGLLGKLDVTMAEHVWYPRVVPFFVYLVMLAITGAVAERTPSLYPLLYLVQISVVSWLLWRYRRLLPELNLRFHWLAVPTGVIVFIAWVWLGMVIDEWTQVRRVGVSAFTQHLIDWSTNPAAPLPLVNDDGSAFTFMDADSRDDSVFVRMGLEQNAPLAWTAFVMRLVGMSLVVPLFEELFVRSLLLRSFHNARNTKLGFVQVAQDFPVVGERLMGTKIAEEADKLPPMFESEFKRVPLGALSLFGVFASTLVFTLSHVPRDYAGCLFCGVAYCLCLYFTRHKGLGPVVWAHGITNALIWAYTLHTSDWRFL